ncbi:MAG: zinc-binding dehydrogenase [Floccifex sp.]
MNTSKALLIKNKNELEFQTLQIPELNDYEVLFHTQATSLCTVDRRAYLGTRNFKYPFLGGHECSGIIEKVGKNVIDLKPGNHAIFTSAYCMQCELDRTGRQTQCKNKQKEPQRILLPNGTIQGGGLSEYLVIPCWQIIKIQNDIPFEQACLTEPLACCIHSIRKARIQIGETVVIIGMGIMGYFHLKLAKMQGARVIVSEMDSTRQEFARKEGAWMVIDPSKQNLKETIKDITNGLGADVIINTIPASSIWLEALDTLAPYGRLIAYSSQDKKEDIGIQFGMIHSKEIEIIGTLNPTLYDNDTAVKCISYGFIDMKKVISGMYPFEKGIHAFQQAVEPGQYRVIIQYEGSQSTC